MTSAATPVSPAPDGHALVRRVSTYMAVGALSFLVDATVLVCLRQLASLPVWLAATAGFWAGFGVNFTLQRTVTFAARGRLGTHVARYAALVALNYVGTVLIVVGADHVGIGYRAGKVAAVTLFAVVNFCLYGRWVFSEQEPRR